MQHTTTSPGPDLTALLNYRASLEKRACLTGDRIFVTTTLLEHIATTEDLELIYVFLSSIALDRPEKQYFEEIKIKLLVYILSFDAPKRQAALASVINPDHPLGQFFGKEYTSPGELNSLLKIATTSRDLYLLLCAPVFTAPGYYQLTLSAALSRAINWFAVDAPKIDWQVLGLYIEIVSSRITASPDEIVTLLLADVQANGCFAKTLAAPTTVLNHAWFCRYLVELIRLGAAPINIISLLNANVSMNSSVNLLYRQPNVNEGDVLAYVNLLNCLLRADKNTYAAILKLLAEKNNAGSFFENERFICGETVQACVEFFLNLLATGVSAADIKQWLQQSDKAHSFIGRYFAKDAYYAECCKMSYQLLSNDLVPEAEIEIFHRHKKDLVDYILELPNEEKIIALKRAIDPNHALGKVLLLSYGMFFGKYIDSVTQKRLQQELEILCPELKQPPPPPIPAAASGWFSWFRGNESVVARIERAKPGEEQRSEIARLET